MLVKCSRIYHLYCLPNFLKKQFLNFLYRRQGTFSFGKLSFFLSEVLFCICKARMRESGNYNLFLMGRIIFSFLLYIIVKIMFGCYSWYVCSFFKFNFCSALFMSQWSRVFKDQMGGNSTYPVVLVF